MTRKLDAAQEGASPVLSLRLSPPLAAALAAEAHRRSTAAGGVPVSPAAVARVLLERALLADPSSSTPDTDDARQLDEKTEHLLQTVISDFRARGRHVPPEIENAVRPKFRALVEQALLGRFPKADPTEAPQEAAQRPRRGSTPRSTARRAEAVAEPPTASAVVADDDQGDAEHKRRRAAQAAVVADDDQEAADARHAARGRAHTELALAATLRADLGALIERKEWSSRRIGPAIGVSGRAVSQFVNGSTEGWPRWGEAARAWLDALPAAAPSPDLQRPLFTPEEGTP